MSTSQSSSGAGGEGRKPTGGSGGRAGMAISPTKTLPKSPWVRVQEASKSALVPNFALADCQVLPFLHRVMNGQLAYDIGNALADLMTTHHVNLPPFLSDIDAAHNRVRNLGVNPNTEPFFIQPSTQWNRASDILFHHFYRSPRQSISVDPTRLIDPHQYRKFHQLAIDRGRASGGTVGPYGPLLTDFLLAMVNCSVRYTVEDNPDDPAAKCNHCHGRDTMPCAQVVDPRTGEVLLLGSCTECHANSCKNCSFCEYPSLHWYLLLTSSATARRIAAHMPPRTPNERDKYVDGRDAARAQLGHNRNFRTPSMFQTNTLGPVVKKLRLLLPQKLRI